MRAHLFDPVLAVHTSVVDPLPQQITAVYESMLHTQASAARARAVVMEIERSLGFEPVDRELENCRPLKFSSLNSSWVTVG